MPGVPVALEDAESESTRLQRCIAGALRNELGKRVFSAAERLDLHLFTSANAQATTLLRGLLKVRHALTSAHTDRASARTAVAVRAPRVRHVLGARRSAFARNGSYGRSDRSISKLPCVGVVIHAHLCSARKR